MTNAPRPFALAWAAGFFDGEGNVTYGERRKRGTLQRQLQVQIAQSDRAVLDRFCAAVGVGKVYGPYRHRNPHAQPVYVWSVRGGEAAQHVMASLWTWLGEVKREQFREGLRQWRAFVPDIALCEHGSQRLKCTPCRREWTTRGAATRRAARTAAA